EDGMPAIPRLDRPEPGSGLEGKYVAGEFWTEYRMELGFRALGVGILEHEAIAVLGSRGGLDLLSSDIARVGSVGIEGIVDMMEADARRLRQLLVAGLEPGAKFICCRLLQGR